MQIEHSNFKSNQPKSPIIIGCNHLSGPANIGALFRLAEAMGVEKLLFDTTINVASRRMRKAARSTIENVEYIDGIDFKATLQQYQKEGYTLLGLEITSNSQPIQSLDKDNNKWLLLIGNEQSGIEDAILEAVDHRVHISMFGANSSMNVIQATAMALYELRRDE